MKIKNTLDDIIAERFTDSLILGNYHMGDTILVNDLVEKYGVSRTPVMQALAKLSTQEILEKSASGKFRLPVYTQKDIDDICKARIMFEETAIREIFDSEEKRRNVLKKLQVYEKRCVKALEEKDYLEFSKQDLNFHRSIVEAIGNSVITSLYHNVQGKFIIANYLAFPLMERKFEKTIQEHELLLKEFAEGTLEETEETIRAHIYQVTEIIRELKLLET